MKGIPHFIVSLMLALPFYQFYGLKALWVIAGGFLIDIDHFLHYIFAFKSFNIKKMHAYYITSNLKNRHILNLFHTVEFFLFAVAILNYYPREAFLFLVGYIPHMLMDYIHVKKTAYKSYKARSPSLALWFFRHYAKAE